HDDVETAMGFLVNEAALEYDQFCRQVQRWVVTARRDGAGEVAVSRRDRRSAKVTLDDDGAVLHAELDALDGAELLEILAFFADAEFRADCDAANAVQAAQAAGDGGDVAEVADV